MLKVEKARDDEAKKLALENKKLLQQVEKLKTQLTGFRCRYKQHETRCRAQGDGPLLQGRSRPRRPAKTPVHGFLRCRVTDRPSSRCPPPPAAMAADVEVGAYVIHGHSRVGCAAKGPSRGAPAAPSAVRRRLF